MSVNVLIIIPARGGSKGIPRKNLRTLAGKPLIYHSIQTALASSYVPDVYVSSDDDEILMIASKSGAKTFKRDASKADDKTTLDPVIFDAFKNISEIEQKNYDIIITFQPTSPLLKTHSLDDAIKTMIENPKIDTIISAKDDTHLTWKKQDNQFIPNYEKRVNRQYLMPIFKETGGFLITRSRIISETNRIGAIVNLALLSDGEEIDIDTYEDWNLCEYYLKRKKILFVVTGNNEVGLGHVYNTLLIAHDILNHHIAFIVDKASRLAYEKIASKNYSVYMQQHENIVDDIKKLSPDIVINDCLDTEEQYIQQLKDNGLKVINFEDLGDGAKYADLVINAIYPENEILPNHHFGHKYFVLRDEFLMTPQTVIRPKVTNVLLTFGGVDPNNYTHKVLEVISQYCQENGITITVVAGFGYDKYETLERFAGTHIVKNAQNISDYMASSDIVFTSAGRTTYELASLGTPSIVLAQNEREITHFFATKRYGFANLGLGYNVEGKTILETFKNIVENIETRLYMSSLMKEANLKTGRYRVNTLINQILEQS